MLHYPNSYDPVHAGAGKVVDRWTGKWFNATAIGIDEENPPDRITEGGVRAI